MRSQPRSRFGLVRVLVFPYFTEEQWFVHLCPAPRVCRDLCRDLRAVCEGAKVKVWDQHAPSHYEKAQFQQAVVSSEGMIRLGRRWAPFADLDAAHVWDLVEVKDGVLFAAAGDEGKVYKITPDGKILYRIRRRTEPAFLSRPGRRRRRLCWSGAAWANPTPRC